MNENEMKVKSAALDTEEKVCTNLGIFNYYIDKHKVAFITAHSKEKSVDKNKSLAHDLWLRLEARGFSIYEIAGKCLDRETGEEVCEAYFAAIDTADRDIEAFSNAIFSLRDAYNQEKVLVFAPGSGGLIAYSDGDVTEYDCDHFEEWFSFTSFNYGTPLEITNIRLRQRGIRAQGIYNKYIKLPGEDE